MRERERDRASSSLRVTAAATGPPHAPASRRARFDQRQRHTPSVRPSHRAPARYNSPALYGPMKVCTGSSHPALAQEICAILGVSQGHVSVYSFSDGENYVQIDENVRGADVFVMQPTSPPVNDNLMELLIMLDAFKRSSARRVTAVLPYYGYARQDRKDKPRVPITSKLVADLITAAGADRVLTVDLHASQIQGFFNIPVDHLFAAPVIVRHLKTLNLEDVTIVSPDAGGVERARAYAKRLGATLAIIDKRRVAANPTEVMNIICHLDR